MSIFRLRKPRLPAVGRILRSLWQMLNAKRRVLLVSLLTLLVCTGILEMGGMLVLFGYIRGLEVHADGRRNGAIARGLDLIFGRPLEQVEFVAWGGLAVFTFMVGKTLFGTSVRFALNRMLMKLNQRISEQMYRTYMQAPYEVFARKGFKAPAQEIGKIFGLFGRCFGATTQLLADSSVLFMTWVLLLWIDPHLTLLASTVFMAVGIGVYAQLSKQLGRMGKEQDEAERKVSRYLNEGLEGVIHVRLRGSRDYYSASYAQALGRTAMMTRRKQAMSRLPRSANELALAGIIVGITFYVTLRGQTVATALPTLGVFGFAMVRMNGIISRVNVAAQVLRRKIDEFESAFNRLRELAPATFGLPHRSFSNYFSDERPLPPGVNGKLTQELVLKEVTFSYPGKKKEVVRKVSIRIRRGEFISICGPSGSGKSTLLLLIMGLMRPTSGEIKCDGWSIFDHIQTWHRSIGYVGQSSLLVARSIRDNVAFGMEPDRVDDAKIWAALALASADGFVRELEEQLDYELLEGGSNLSGGQRQRLMIARALYEDPEVVVLDEATAALDNITEREVTEAIINLSGKKTIICVAHRLSTIKNSRRVYFMKNHRIAAKGTFADLLTKSRGFADMVAAGEGSLRPVLALGEALPADEPAPGETSPQG